MSHPKFLLFKMISYGALVVGLGAGILFVPNLSVFDEALLPEIVGRLSNPPNPTVEGNAAYYLYGIAAASDQTPDTVGKAVIATLQSKHANGEMAELTEQETAELYGGNKKWDEEWSQTYLATNCNPRARIDCFGELLTQIKSRPFSQPRLLVQLERYKQLIKLPHLIEDIRLLDYKSPMPNYYIAMQLGKLAQASAYQESGLDGLISNSQEDMQFWRMALTDSQTLLGKMVAVASLRRNLAAISYAISKAPSVTAEQIQQLQELLKPLSAEETNIEKALIGELRFSAESWKTAPKHYPEGTPLILALLSQPNASCNWYYRQTLKPAFALNQLPPAEFYQRAQTPTRALTFFRFNPYNLGGKLYQSKNWQYASYIGRAKDLAGIYWLLALQLDLKTRAVQDVNAAIKISPYKNPYTGKPFDYDSNINILGFPCFDAKETCNIAL